MTRRLASPGVVLMLLGAVHAVWGIAVYHDPLAEIARAGVFDTVGDGIFKTTGDRGARATALWFMVFAPLVALIGYLVEAAIRARDGRALKVAAWAVLGFGLALLVAVPRSPLWLALPISWWLFRTGKRVSR